MESKVSGSSSIFSTTCIEKIWCVVMCGFLKSQLNYCLCDLYGSRDFGMGVILSSSRTFFINYSKWSWTNLPIERAQTSGRGFLKPNNSLQAFWHGIEVDEIQKCSRGLQLPFFSSQGHEQQQTSSAVNIVYKNVCVKLLL